MATVCQASSTRATIAFLFLLALSCTSLWSQQIDSCLKRAVVVNVRDGDGRFVTGLPPASFRSSLQRQPVKFLASKQEAGQYRIVLLLDVSASISQSSSTWSLLQRVAGDFLSSPPRNAQVATAFFASKIDPVFDFSHSSAQMLEALGATQDARGVVAKGERQTALFDSIRDAMHVFGDLGPGDVIFAITDGHDNASKTSQGDVKKELEARSVRFFAFYLTQFNMPIKDGVPGAVVLRDVALASGGAVLDIPDQNETTILYDSSPKGREAMRVQLSYLYDMMSRYYRLEMQLPSALARATNWNLDIVDERGKTRKDVELFYPRQLASCAMLSAAK